MIINDGQAIYSKDLKLNVFEQEKIIEIFQNSRKIGFYFQMQILRNGKFYLMEKLIIMRSQILKI